jgi:16S rRNA G966 N2-methylase RsmD
MKNKYQEAFDKFVSAGDQSDLGMDIAAITKRKWSTIVAEKYSFENGLDLFGGVGYSGFIYAQCCKKLAVVEKDKSKFKLLQKNIGHLPNVNLINEDNLIFLKKCKNKIYDLIDFDPFANANPQLDYLKNIFNKGVVFVTSGEIMRVCRNLQPAVSWCDDEISKKYVGKAGAWKWVEEIYIPYLKNKYEIDPVFFYSFPTSTRIIFTKDFNIDSSLFSPEDKYLGWFKKYAQTAQRGFKL